MLLKAAKFFVKLLFPDAVLEKFRKVRANVRANVRLKKTRDLLHRDPDDWGALRALSRLVSNGHCSEKFYFDSIGCFDHSVKLLPLENAVFVGKGGGAWNLNAYRCGGYDGQKVFEKVYLIDSDAWKKLGWVYDEVLPSLENEVLVPNVAHVVKSEKLAAVYFQYVAGAKPINRNEILPKALNFYKSVKDYKESSRNGVLVDFRREVLYQSGVNRLLKIMDSSGESRGKQLAIEAWLMGHHIPRVFTHGDFSHNNVMSNGFVLDFDRAGYYPVGYEFGRLAVMFDGFDSVKSIEDFAEQYLHPHELCAKVSILYFAALFSSRVHRSVKVSDSFILSLLDRAHDIVINYLANDEQEGNPPAK